MTNEALNGSVKKKKKTCHSTRHFVSKAFALKSRPGDTAATVLPLFFHGSLLPHTVSH